MSLQSSQYESRVTVTVEDGAFVCKCSFEDRIIPKASGFRWNDLKKIWYTFDYSIAARLWNFLDETAKNKINKSRIEVISYVGPLPPAPDGLNYLPHQEESALFSLSRNRSYLGLDPGLGKTIVAAIISRALGLPTVYISPPFLTRNVRAEFSRWAPRLSTLIYPDKSPRFNRNVLIVPDSLIQKIEVRETIQRFVGSKPALLIVDEAHRYKNQDAKRTLSLLGGHKRAVELKGLVELFSNVVFMSGTPMPNRPIELYPMLIKLAPETIDYMDRYEYGRKYCRAHQTQFGHWDFSGAAHVADLAKRVVAPTGPFMLRLKKELLKLPPKISELFIFSSDLNPRLAKMDADIGEKYVHVVDIIKAQLAGAIGKDESELHISTYRKLLGFEKSVQAAEYIESLLEETDESILVFAFHKETIKSLEHRLEAYAPLVITGETKMEDRHRYVEEFQSLPQRRLLVANYVAAGIGFTLTKATRVIFVEFSWVPGENEQASDRAHRIGQDRTVLVQYMVYQNSVDKAVIEALLNKKRAIDEL